MVCNYGPGGNVVTQTDYQKANDLKETEQVYQQGTPIDEWWNDQ